MDSAENSQWRIDSLDARAGLAFVSKRAMWSKAADEAGGDGKLGNDEVDELEKFQETKFEREPTTFFLAPPMFQPEPIRNRSVALAAGRGFFQEGLFIDDQEVAFPDLASVQEFVRRAYVRSGSGDGQDGPPTDGNVPPPPSSDGPRPEFDRFENRDIPERTVLLELISDFEAQSEELRFAGSADSRTLEIWDPFPGTTVTKQQRASNRGGRMICAGAILVLQELMRRKPKWDADQDSRLHWRRAGSSFLSLIQRMGLVPILFDDFADELSKFALAAVDLTIGGRPGEPYQPFTEADLRSGPWDVMGMIFMDSADVDQIYRRELRGYGNPFRVAAFGHAIRSVDPIRRLRNLPLELPSSRRLGLSRTDGNLYNFLVGFLAKPVPDEACIDLAVFSAAVIVSESVTLDEHVYFYDGRSVALALNEASVSNLERRSWSWIAEHLPKVVFPKVLEDAIADASSLALS